MTHVSARSPARDNVSVSATPAGDVPARLVAVAAELFARNGFENTSVQAIVNAAGVTKGGMYHYFSSKDDLLHEIYARVLRVQLAQLTRVATSDLAPADRVSAATVDVVRSTIANLDDMVVFFRSFHQLHPDKQRQVRAERRRYHEQFRAMIEEGQRSGEFRSDIPADLVVDYHFGAVHHISDWYRTGGSLHGADIGRRLADLLLAALRPEHVAGGS